MTYCTEGDSKSNRPSSVTKSETNTKSVHISVCSISPNGPVHQRWKMNSFRGRAWRVCVRGRMVWKLLTNIWQFRGWTAFPCMLMVKSVHSHLWYKPYENNLLTFAKDARNIYFSVAWKYAEKFLLTTHTRISVLLWHRSLLPFFSHTSRQYTSVYVLSSFTAVVTFDSHGLQSGWQDGRSWTSSSPLPWDVRQFRQ